MTDERLVIVGAGVGGLAAAIELAVAGFAVTVVERGRVSGVLLATGERLAAAAVVINADAAALSAGLFGSATKGAIAEVPAAARSLSALTVSPQAATDGFALCRHNVFFSMDYAAEFAALCQRRALPDEPTVYICAQDREDGAATVKSPGSEGAPERLFCIINAPATGDRELFENAEIKRCVNGGLSVLNRCGLHLRTSLMDGRITSPRDFEQRFPMTGGALYGRATHGSTASFQRPGSRTRVPGLYLAGGSAHPGPGVPMAALSGRLAAQSLIEDSRSIGRSQKVAMPGGT